MQIDFDQLRAGATDDITAKVLRERFMLDERSSASGAVVCDRQDIERLLASGQLEPVLSVEQYLCISRGKSYGAASHRPATPGALHAEPLGANDGTNWAGHPDWSEYQALSEPMKSALHHDFRTYLFVKRRGGLASLTQSVGDRIESSVAEQARAHDRASIERAVEDAPVVEAERFNAALQWAQGKKSYPGLQKTKGR